MPSYFSGQEMGTVSRLSQSTFAGLCGLILQPQRLSITQSAFAALSKREQQAAKRVRYLVPAEFAESPCGRHKEKAIRCNLIALDVDDRDEASRLLTQRWVDCLGSLAFVVWQTVSSTPESPRLRVLVAANGIHPASYVAAARTVAEMVGISHITSAVTFHAVQPAFLPTIFSDTQDYSPIIASNPDGDAFTTADIVADSENSLVDTGPQPTNDMVADLAYLRAPMEGVSLDDAAEALTFLDADMPMQAWIEVAAGLKHQFHDKEKEAFDVWDAWSAKGTKYIDRDETSYRWKSLKAQPTDRAPVTIRSVFKLATARGWTNPTLAKRQHQDTLSWLRAGSRSTEELLDQGAKRIAKVSPVLGQLERTTLLVALRDTLHARDIPLPLPDIKREVRQLERDAARSTGLVPWSKGLCYVTASNLFYRHSTDRKFAPEVLDLMYTLPPIGDEKAMRPRDYVIQIAQCAQVENLRYEPAQGTKRYFSLDEVPYVNTYRADYAAPDKDYAEEAGEIISEHMAKLIREPEYQAQMLSFMAFQVQQPGRKVRWAPLLQSGEGAGKSTLHEIMTCCLGRRNTTKVAGNKIMDSAYNDWAGGRQIVTIEEIRIIGSNRHAIMDKLKPLITDDQIDLNVKYEDHRNIPNIANYLLLTNYQDALAIREDGRRYFVVQSPLQSGEAIKELEQAGWFKRVYEFLRDHPGGVRAWFENYKLADNFDPNGRAPVTPYLREFAANAASPLAAAVMDALEDEPHPLVQGDLLSLSCLRGCLDCTKLSEFSDQALAAVLRESGWTRLGRVLVDGARHQLYSKRPFADARATAEGRIKYL